MNATNTLLTASVDDVPLSFTTSVMPATGYIAVATQSIQASFDDIVVTQP